MCVLYTGYKNISSLRVGCATILYYKLSLSVDGLEICHKKY